MRQNESFGGNKAKYIMSPKFANTDANVHILPVIC